MRIKNASHLTTVLITGASGFLGRYLLRCAPPGLRILAQYHRRKIDKLPDHCHPLQLDLTQSDWSDLTALPPQLIIHTAALADPEACEEHPGRSRRINFEATCRLTDVAATQGARLIFISTDLVYDGRRGGYSEDDPPHPMNVYARDKVEAGNYILKSHPNAVAVRCALIYGKSLSGQPTFTERMVASLRAGTPVNLLTDEFRTPIEVASLARALWELALTDFTGVINIGGRQKLSRFQMGEEVCRALHLPAALLQPRRIVDLHFRAFRPADTSLDTSLARRLLKTALPEFREAIAALAG